MSKPAETSRMFATLIQWNYVICFFTVYRDSQVIWSVMLQSCRSFGQSCCSHARSCSWIPCVQDIEVITKGGAKESSLVLLGTLCVDCDLHFY